MGMASVFGKDNAIDKLLPIFLQLLKDQIPEPIGSKDYTKGFSALSDYGVTQIYCSESQLEETGIKSGELNINVELLTDDEINQLFFEHQSVLSF